MIPVFPALFICWMYALSKPLSKRCLTLIAIGNRSMGDDGIGLLVVESIKKQLPDDIDVQIWENMDALSVTAELLEIQTAIVIVDCADMGLNAGESKWFKQSECVLSQHLNLISTHGFGFAEALALAETLGFKQKLFFFAIQPSDISFDSAFNNEISEALKNNIAAMCKSLLLELSKLLELAKLLELSELEQLKRKQ